MLGDKIHLLPLCFLMASTSALGCGGSTGGGDGDQKLDGDTKDSGGSDSAKIVDAGFSCDASPLPSSLGWNPPERKANGSKAAAVFDALGATLAAQSLPQAESGQSYELSTLDCTDVWVPLGDGGDEGYVSAFDYRVGTSGKYTSVDLPPSSSLTEPLFNALQAAGAVPFNDMAHGEFIMTRNVMLSASSIAFEDISSDPEPIPANVSAKGAAADAILETLIAAGIHDKNIAKDGELFVVCTTLGDGGMTGPAACSTQFTFIVGGGFQTADAGPAFDAAQSAKLWQELTAAAKASGVKPMHGTFAESTVLNATSFTFDCETLKFHLVADDAVPPPPPAPSP